MEEEAFFKQIATQDSGFLLKKEVMQISAIAKVMDSVNKMIEDYEKADYMRDGEHTEDEYIEYLKFLDGLSEKRDTENDTIAKYYKKNNGNYIFAVGYNWDIFDGSNVLIEISPQGNLLKRERYDHCYYGSPCGNFNKHGDFFSLETYTCGYGGTFDISLYLFKEVTTKDSLIRIPFFCWLSALFFDDEMPDDKYKDMDCYGEIKKIENDSLIISYT